jgi:hypothetical protein
LRNPVLCIVMPGHSRSTNGVASLACVPGIHVFSAKAKDVDGRVKPGHDGNQITLSRSCGNRAGGGTNIDSR